MFTQLLTAAVFCLASTSASNASAQSQADIQDSTAALEMGTHTLTGRPSVTRHVSRENGVANWFLGTKSERVHSRLQTVTLYPYTPFVDAQLRRNRNYTSNMLLSSLEDVANYTARSITDAEGVFTFRNLKPGRYVLSSKVPFEAAVTTRSDTGQTRTETTLNMAAGTAESVTSRIYDYHQTMSKFEHHLFRVIEVKADSKITELGDLE